ncbi:hypothetical protein ACIQC7_34775 [Kitasatospora sp. NPDC088556]|uniref:hypothetical protein n=1 Tax=Kitasatospora sp. NPDC088556 TaxID=3364076 RepID=UPI0038035C05
METTTFTVHDPGGTFRQQLLALLAEHVASVAVEEPEVPDNRWTVERAGLYYEHLPPRAREILRELTMDYDGAARPDEIRRSGRSLRGSTGAFRRILNEGARKGLWPPGLPLPVRSFTKGGKVLQINMPGWGTPEDVHPPFYAYFEADGERRRRAAARRGRKGPVASS